MIVYLKRTPVTGAPYMTWHQTWDADHFIKSVRAAEAKLAREKKNFCAISVVSEEEYREYKWPKKEKKRAQSR